MYVFVRIGSLIRLLAVLAVVVVVVVVLAQGQSPSEAGDGLAPGRGESVQGTGVSAAR